MCQNLPIDPSSSQAKGTKSTSFVRKEISRLSTLGLRRCRPFYVGVSAYTEMEPKSLNMAYVECVRLKNISVST